MSDALFHVFIVAGEESGDQLGATLIKALKQRLGGDLIVSGVGGRAMTEQGLQSLFDMDEIAVMGVTAVIPRLPKILKRINETAKAAIAAKPDALVIIDSPDFTHRVARKVKAAMPNLPVIDYVCPSVWAWRPGRASKMRTYVDHVLALLPFEPQALKELNGPATTYVGHPLATRITKQDQRLETDTRKTLLVLPGSRSGEIKRLLPIFQQTLQKLTSVRDDIDIVIPAVPHLEATIRSTVSQWPLPVRIASGEDEKKAAFNKASAALAASGTVCLELGLANIPMLATYKLDPIASKLRFLMTTWSTNLVNLIIDYPIVPEYIDVDLHPGKLYRALNRLLDDTPERHTQLEAFKVLREKMALEEGVSSDEKAADIIMQLTTKSRSS
ncbi:MAG: lipid-A-disaccharide synthase [Hyphomicrobiales bacterium]